MDDADGNPHHSHNPNHDTQRAGIFFGEYFLDWVVKEEVQQGEDHEQMQQGGAGIVY